MSFNKIKNTIAESGVAIESIYTFFREKHEHLLFSQIKEVKVRQAFFEKDKNIITVLIYTGKTDGGGNRVYSRLTGIRNYNQVAGLIEKRARLSG